jgi:hypothetical protein
VKNSISKFEFRVWDKQTNKFTYFNLRETMGVLPLDIPDECIQQYTGVFDKFEKPLFVGDFILHGHEQHFCEIQWADYKFVFLDSWNGMFYDLDCLLKDTTIVGNIFEGESTK